MTATESKKRKVLAVSEFTKNEALNYYDRSNKIELVYNTVDCDVSK